MTRKQRILVFRYGQLGDTLVALPAFWAVRRHFPDAHITLLTSSHTGERFVSALSVFPPEGLFDDYLVYGADVTGIKVQSAGALFRRVRRGAYNTLVYLPPVRPSTFGVLRDLMFFRAAGVRTIIGHNGLRTITKPTTPGPLPVVEHEVDYLLSRLARSNIPIPGPGQAKLDLRLGASERDDAKAWLREHLPGQEPYSRLVGFGPGSKWPSKIWPADRFRELGHRLISETNATPIVFGGAAEAELGHEFVQDWGRGVVAAGVHSVRGSAALLACCVIYVGNDTGTMHLAAAENVPCVAVFSAQDWPGRWYPYGPGHRVLREPVPCEGCRLQVCDRGLPCLLGISVDQVTAACCELMGTA
jgi:heptosyltransferase III